MIPRHQPPVHSPLSARALVAGLLPGHDKRRRLTDRLAAEYGAAAVHLVDSGTSALGLALRWAAAFRPDTPVALPAYSCYDIATAADTARMPVRLYDVDPATLAPDRDSLARVVAAGVAAVVVAPLYGLPVDTAAVLDICRAHDAALIEDIAQAVGAGWSERPAGTAGALTVLSFGRGKGWTGAGGGALLVRDPSAVVTIDRLVAGIGAPPGRMRALLAAGAQWALARPSLYAIPSALPFLGLGETVYRAPTTPRHIGRAAPAVLALTRALHDVEVTVRRAHAARLAARVRAPLRTVTTPAAADPSYLRLPIVAPAGSTDRVGAARRLGVMPGYPRALADLPVFGARASAAAESYAGARLLAERLFTLPTHSLLAERDIAALEAWLDSW